MKIGKLQWGAGTLVLSSILLFGIGSISTEAKEALNTKERITFTQDQVYIEECGSCHLAYPPNLLPAESWEAIMSGLADHFGENAELDAETARHISDYIAQTLANSKRTKMSKLQKGLKNKTPLRITELPHFVHEHDEIPKRLIVDNPDVKSLSQCDSCHKDAARGLFNENRISIPGYGRWDD